MGGPAPQRLLGQPGAALISTADRRQRRFHFSVVGERASARKTSAPPRQHRYAAQGWAAVFLACKSLDYLARIRLRERVERRGAVRDGIVGRGRQQHQGNLDKGAKLLGLAYPGGPQVESLAAKGDAEAFEFPKAISPRNKHCFSFSGLKTSLRYRLEKIGDVDLKSIIPDLCAGYQRAVIEQLVFKTKHLIQAGNYNSLGISGGVSNNKVLRARMERLAQEYHVPFLAARPHHTGDNAAMIAFATFADPSNLALGKFNIDSSLSLTSH